MLTHHNENKKQAKIAIVTLHLSKEIMEWQIHTETHTHT